MAAGLASTARVITAAALIMVCVFVSFIINDPLRVINIFALGLATAIFVDPDPGANTADRYRFVT